MPAVSSPMPTPQPAINAKTYLRVVFKDLDERQVEPRGRTQGISVAADIPAASGV